MGGSLPTAQEMLIQYLLFFSMITRLGMLCGTNRSEREQPSLFCGITFQKKMFAKECNELENIILGRDTTFHLLSVEDRCERIDLLKQFVLPEMLEDHLLMIAPVNHDGRLMMHAYSSHEIDAEILRITSCGERMESNMNDARKIDLSWDAKDMRWRRQRLVDIFARIASKQEGASFRDASFSQIKYKFLQQVKRGRCQDYGEVLQLVGLVRFR